MFFARPVSSASKRMFGVSIFVDKSKNGFCGKMNPTNRTNRLKTKRKVRKFDKLSQVEIRNADGSAFVPQKTTRLLFLTVEGSSQFALNGFCSFKLFFKSSNFPATLRST